MFSYLNPWQPQLVFPPNHQPYVPAPPPVSQVVWILDCKSCGTFLTNRGMKAVLLLRPNVALYSSDALPVNCSSAQKPEPPRPATACPARPLQRTCECLTQTLCCHGCGTAIGYMIVIPCSRCTSSISTTNRATNGHRFVFHSSEIKASERHYISDEPGVICTEATATSSRAPVLAAYSASALHNGFHNRFHNHRSPVFYSHHSQLPLAAASHPEFLPTPPLDLEDDSPPSSNAPSPTAPSFPFPNDSSHLTMDSPSLYYPVSHSDHFHADYPHSIHHTHTSRNRATSAASSESSHSSPPPLIPHVPAFGLPAEHLEAPVIPPLQAGEVLFWHHLVRHGEIPGVMEDARARRPVTVGKTRVHFDR
ncbi:hypothetical protein DFH08DRAFT_1006848 [Mycena albidolilacea]|uniref:Protein FAM72A n=1 Tax=Mycena albidolilacea TaxID=1033008 RepID=A0AAD7EQU0_9AGAR|nr:hypothetical protein DFH08DRAFT_1006848 [Mycena albidolilacea]